MNSTLQQLKQAEARLDSLLKLKDDMHPASVLLLSAALPGKDPIELELDFSSDLDVLLAAIIDAQVDAADFWLRRLQREHKEAGAYLIERAEEALKELKELKPEEEDPEEEPIAGHVWACPSCRSTVLHRDASVLINDPDQEVCMYDNVSCNECGYDGNRYFKVPMTESELDALIMEPTLTEDKVAGLKAEYL